MIRRGEAADRADLLFRHLAERLAVAAHRANRMTKSWTQPAEHGADDDPERSGEVAELRGERRADQRAGAGDGREVMAEDDPLVGGLEVVAVRAGARQAWRDCCRAP